MKIGSCETVYYVWMMGEDTVFIRAVINTANKNHIRIYTMKQSRLVVTALSISPVGRNKLRGQTIHPTLGTLTADKSCILLDW